MCWLEDAINFLFPELVEVDMDGVEVDPSITEFCREVRGLEPSAIPDFYRAEPAVAEAERVVRSRR
jgi:hypothetical protein